MWIYLVLFYGIIKGIREVCKKKALEKNTIAEVLVISTLISFLLVLPDAPRATGLLPMQYLWIAVKSFVIFVGWILGFKAIKKLPISMYGVLDLSRVIFATVLGITVLGETPTVPKTIGMLLVCGGLLFLKFNPFHRKENSGVKARAAHGEKMSFNRGSTAWYIFLAFLSCALNAVSGLLDKVLMKDLTHSQLQFWYMLFLLVYYVLYVLVTRTKISPTVFKNIWVWLLAILLIVMDRALFIANGDAASQITVMTLIKQSGVIVTILAGKFIFKEKDILHKVLCAIIIIAGIVIGVM